jgi:hypothetical protein
MSDRISKGIQITIYIWPKMTFIVKREGKTHTHTTDMSSKRKHEVDEQDQCETRAKREQHNPSIRRAAKMATDHLQHCKAALRATTAAHALSKPDGALELYEMKQQHVADLDRAEQQMVAIGWFERFLATVADDDTVVISVTNKDWCNASAALRRAGTSIGAYLSCAPVSVIVEGDEPYTIQHQLGLSSMSFCISGLAEGHTSDPKEITRSEHASTTWYTTKQQFFDLHVASRTAQYFCPSEDDGDVFIVDFIPAWAVRKL